jgi:hypothetical protein
MVPRYVETRRPRPAGVLAAAGAGSMLLESTKMREWM